VSWPESITIERSHAPAWDPDAIRAVQELIERYEAQVTPTTPKDEAWFGWIPLRFDVFLEGLLVARERLGIGRHRLLEIGSGLGSKLVLAHALGFDAMGIEHHQPYVDACRQLFPHVEVRGTDAESFEAYGGFDVIYSNRVASSLDRQDQIHRRISEQMRPGALLFAANSRPPDWLEHVAGLVWRKSR
jgi:2-polyprenyl-3-methyl-5-hydroxy-6-metoxy-1,4-benzoquinol methylase